MHTGPGRPPRQPPPGRLRRDNGPLSLTITIAAAIATAAVVGYSLLATSPAG